MVKRRTDSNSEDDSSPVDTKRARTVDSDGSEDEEDLEIPSNFQNKGKGKGKARNVAFDEDEGDAEAEDNRFEQQHRETILAGLEEKRKVHGVRVFSAISLLIFSIMPCAHLGYRGPWYNRVYRDASIHVPQMPLVHIWSTD